ncbi:MAG: hypothetical protein ACOVLC_14605 [Flavobacterium sp.]
MERKIKLIWDFRGPAAEKTALHHEIHLKEFIEQEKKQVLATGVEHYNDVYSIAFLAVIESDMIFYRDALKPHRATLYETNPA